MRPFGGGGVGVHPLDARFLEQVFEFLLDALSARAELGEFLMTAVLAFLRDWPRGAAVVAFHAILSGVVGESDAAILASQRETAFGAEEERSVSPSVEEDDDLLISGEFFLDLEAEFVGERGLDCLPLLSLAQVNELDVWEGLALDSDSEPRPTIFAHLDVVVALEGGRGGAEDDDGASGSGAHDGDITRLVARRFALLI